MSSNRSTGEANGLGSLADELGETWGEEEGESYIEFGGQDSSFLEGLQEGNVGPVACNGSQILTLTTQNDLHEFGFGINISSPPRPMEPHSLKPRIEQSPCSTCRHKHEPQTHSAPDAFDYGRVSPASNLIDISSSFASCLRNIEKVTHQSAEVLEEDGGVVVRTTKAMKDLGPPQSNIEGHTIRLITAYTSMATHRTHKTRELFGQAHSLLYGGPYLSLSEELIELLLSEISELESTISTSPSPTTNSAHPCHTSSALHSLHLLSTETAALTTHLRSLTDTIQESRISSNLARRRLKSVCDMVEDMRLEEELLETSITLIQAGDWDRRCRERRAAWMVREVVTGFAKTCDVMRERWVRKCQVEHNKSGQEEAGFRSVGIEVFG